MPVYIETAMYSAKCESCGSHENTMRIKFLRPKDEYVMYLCAGCYCLLEGAVIDRANRVLRE